MLERICEGSYGMVRMAQQRQARRQSTLFWSECIAKIANTLCAFSFNAFST
jgi:hypothetical protein